MTLLLTDNRRGSQGLEPAETSQGAPPGTRSAGKELEPADHIPERRQGCPNPSRPGLGVGCRLCEEITTQAWVMLLLVTA